MHQSLGQCARTTSIATDLHAPVTRQVVKYLIAGAIAAGVDLLVFHFLATVLLRCVDERLGDPLRCERFVIDKTVAFIIANALSYWLNVQWVFSPGRRNRGSEIVLFFGVSLFSYACGMQLGRVLIGTLGVPTHTAALACIGAATLLNFVFRKLVVFR